MKVRNISYVLICVTGLLLMACSTSTTSYSYKSKAEKKLIANFFSRNGIETVETLPTDSEFFANPKLYYHHQYYYGDFYYHLDKRAEGFVRNVEDSVVGSETIVMRYKQYTLEEPSDTVSFWTTLDSPYPTEFIYLSDYTNACYGWHYAVGLMGYNESECTCIIPSRLGNSDAQNSVTPYGYKIKIWVKM